MYPIMSTGNTVIQAVKVLKEHGVKEDCIILSNLFCTPIAVQSIIESYPKVPLPEPYSNSNIFLITLFSDENFDFRNPSSSTKSLWAKVFWNGLK